MPEITLSPDQATAYDAIQDWLNNPDRPYLTMGGYAGTGKTTIIKHLCEVKDDFSIHVCALTGKAALNAGAKLQHMSNITVSTIHSFLYRPLTDDEGNLIGWELRSYNEWEKPSLIVVDEASMVTEKIFIDLLALDIPILFVGDHGQLPPITKNEDRVDDERVQAHRNAAGVFNLMFGPELRLEQIHRQALDSPIIRMSMMARQGTWIKHGDYGEGVCKTDTVAKYEHLLKTGDDWIILTDLNRRRTRLNKMSLRYNGFDEFRPTINSRVVCLKNNFQIATPIFNGMLGNIQSVEEATEHRLRASILLDDGNTYRGLISKYMFNNEKGVLPDGVRYREAGDLFDFGYALTVHKAQGSEFDRVFIFGTGFGEWRNQWLYTAITRAKKELYICCDKI